MTLERKTSTMDRVNDEATKSKSKHKNDAKKKSKSSKKPKNPFKKGSWKHTMWKYSHRRGKVKYMEEFHFTRMTNLVIEKDGKWKSFNKRLKKSYLEKLSTKNDESFILIRGDSFGYYRLSIKDYLKMSRIENIAMHIGINLLEDGCDDYNDQDDPFYSVIIDSDYTITSINQLANMVAEMSSSAMILNHLTMRDWWYNIVEIDIRGVISYSDGGKSKAFKFTSFDELYEMFHFM